MAAVDITSASFAILLAGLYTFGTDLWVTRGEILGTTSKTIFFRAC